MQITDMQKALIVGAVGGALIAKPVAHAVKGITEWTKGNLARIKAEKAAKAAQ